MPKLLTVKQVADILGLHEQVVRRYIRKEMLPAIKINREYRVDEEDLNNWLEERKIGKGSKKR